MFTLDWHNANARHHNTFYEDHIKSHYKKVSEDTNFVISKLSVKLTCRHSIMFIKQLNINQTYFSKAKQLKCWLISLAVLIVLIVVGVLLVLLIGPRLIPSFLVDNSNSNTLTNYSNNDTLVFASVVSGTT